MSFVRVPPVKMHPKNSVAPALVMGMAVEKTSPPQLILLGGIGSGTEPGGVVTGKTKKRSAGGPAVGSVTVGPVYSRTTQFGPTVHKGSSILMRASVLA